MLQAMGVDLASLLRDREKLVRIRKLCLAAALVVALAMLAIDKIPGWYYDPRRHHAEGQITVYSTAWCPVCKRLKACLQAHAVPFDERDVEKDKQAGYEYWALGGGGVPLTLIGQETVSGLHRQRLEGLLEKAGHRVDCSQAVRPKE